MMEKAPRPSSGRTCLTALAINFAIIIGLLLIAGAIIIFFAYLGPQLGEILRQTIRPQGVIFLRWLL